MSKIPVVYIYGESDSGKTLLVERLVRDLLMRGVRVATVKLSKTEALDLGPDHKDTNKHLRAGSVATGATSQSNAAIMMSTPMSSQTLIELAFTIGKADLVLVEGLGENVPVNAPKIVVGEAKGRAPGTVMELPSGEAELASVFHLIQKVVTKKIESKGVELKVGGNDIRLKPFVKDYIEGTVRGTIGALKDTGSPGDEIELHIPKREPEA
jgi:molybdopterin-guanine dinucleotide biosynthesis protein MobB